MDTSPIHTVGGHAGSAEDWMRQRQFQYPHLCQHLEWMYLAPVLLAAPPVLGLGIGMGKPEVLAIGIPLLLLLVALVGLYALGKWWLYGNLQVEICAEGLVVRSTSDPLAVPWDHVTEMRMNEGRGALISPAFVTTLTGFTFTLPGAWPGTLDAAQAIISRASLAEVPRTFSSTLLQETTYRKR